MWSLKGKIARGALTTLATRISALGLGFVQSLLLANHLGPQNYGLVVAAVSLSTICATLGLLGLNGYAVREIGRDSGRARGFLHWSLRTVLLAGCGAGLVASVLGTIVVPELWFWGLMLTPLLAMLLLLRGAAQGYGKIIISQSPLDFLKPALIVGTLSLSVLTGFALSAHFALALITAAHLVAAAVAGYLLFRVVPKYSHGPEEIAPKRWMREAFPFYATGILASAQAEILTLILAVFASPTDTALFQVAMRIAALILIVRTAIDVPLAPRLARLSDSGERPELERLACLAAFVSTASSGVIALGILAIHRWLLGLFGEAFVDAGTALVILVGAQFVVVAAGPLPMLLNMTGHAKQLTITFAIAQFFQIVVGIPLVFWAGFVGAAAAVFLTTVFWIMLLILTTRRYLGITLSPIDGWRHWRNGNPVN